LMSDAISDGLPKQAKPALRKEAPSGVAPLSITVIFLDGYFFLR